VGQFNPSQLYFRYLGDDLDRQRNSYATSRDFIKRLRKRDVRVAESQSSKRSFFMACSLSTGQHIPA
jgi:hypothetical protein